jgi:hypothetical protein
MGGVVKRKATLKRKIRIVRAKGGITRKAAAAAVKAAKRMREAGLL